MVKKFLAVCLAVVVFAGSAYAQRGGGSRSSGGFSSGSRSSYSSSSSRSFSSGSSRSYSSSSSLGSKSTYSSSSSSRSTAPKTNISSFDSAASRSSKLASGAAAYKAASAPVQSKIAKTSATASKPRVERERVVYRSVPTTTVVYHDSYHPSLSGWLLQQSPSIMAMWMYNHRAEMDEARYRDMLASNADVRARIAQLEAQKVKADPTYTPPGIDYDVMYRPQPTSYWSGRTIFWWIVAIIILVLIATVVLAYLEEKS